MADANMHTVLNKFLFWFAAVFVALDVLWGELGHFRIDVTNYVLLLLPISFLVAGAFFYARARNEPAISVTMACAAFLVVFSASCSLLSYLLLTIAGPRIDGLLAELDRTIGFSWPAIMAFAAYHPVFDIILRLAYESVIPQTVALLLILGWKQQIRESYGICLSVALGAVITVSLWALFPSFGAFSVYNLPAPVASRLGLALNGNYGHALVSMLANGPGIITPSELRGIVGFPSFHTLQALVLIWYARKLPYLRWLSLMLNSTVLIATPIQGGHHLVDLAGGVVVTIVAIWLSNRTVALAETHAHPATCPLSQLASSKISS